LTPPDVRRSSRRRGQPQRLALRRQLTPKSWADTFRRRAAAGTHHQLRDPREGSVDGLIIVSILAFFEEVGWRAWLLPRLVSRMGARRGVVASALLWAFWHTPYALSGIQHVDGIPIALTTVIMPIGVVGSGLVIGWLWLRTETIWMVALAHGALNNWGQYAFKFMGGPGHIHDGVVLGAGGLALLAVGSLLLARGLPDKITSCAAVVDGHEWDAG